MLSDPTEVVNYFNTFFVEAPTSVLDSLPRVDWTRAMGSLNEATIMIHRIFVSCFTKEEIYEILKSKIKTKSLLGRTKSLLICLSKQWLNQV